MVALPAAPSSSRYVLPVPERLVAQRSEDVDRLAPAGNEPPFPVLEAKVTPPPARAGLVRRLDLLETMHPTRLPAVVTIVAPPGYGKTTLLSQWAEDRADPVAWLNADATDNDPAALLVHLATAIDRVQPIDPAVFDALVAPEPSPLKVRRLLVALDAMPQRMAVVIDHAEAIDNAECREVLQELARSMPGGAHLVLASRHEPPIPSARLRAEARLLEIGADQLALDTADAAMVFCEAGLQVPDEELALVVERTEGWPVGLYLAALAMRNGASAADEASLVSGTDRYLADYLRSEILDHASLTDASFLTRSSILDEMNGALCDFVLERRDSAEVLDRLEHMNRLVVPLDGRRDSYRYHHLFRDLLRADLDRREPEHVEILHRRAATWHETHGSVDLAIAHAQQAGDADGAARLVLEQLHSVWSTGRLDTILAWLRWFEQRRIAGDHPELAIQGAVIHALIGRATDAERWAEVALRAPSTGTTRDGSTIASLQAYLRALRCADGVESMRVDAIESYRGLSPASPYRVSMVYAQGVASLLAGHATQAGIVLAQAVDEALLANTPTLAAIAQTEASIAAAELEDWTKAEALAAAAHSIVSGNRFDEHWSSALVHAWSGRLALRRGDRAQAESLAECAGRLRPLLTYALPVVSLQTLLELGHVLHALGDADGAASVVRQGSEIVARRPALGFLPSRLVELQRELRGADDPSRAEVTAALTAAELRVLPLLATHLTLAEIGERCFVSRNTVKSQAIAIYRKLGVSSRSDAIARARELGLLAL